jgi:hypothetical protein
MCQIDIEVRDNELKSISFDGGNLGAADPVLCVKCFQSGYLF